MGANLSLTLPGDVLYMSPLSTLKKFKNCGNKQGGLHGRKRLAADNLGVLKEKKAPQGTDKVNKFIVHYIRICISNCMSTQKKRIQEIK